jgi:hypothetical protein
VPSRDPGDSPQAYATKLTLIGTFLTSLAVFSTRLIRREVELNLSPWELLLLGLSSYRVGRIIAYERVAKPIRDPFTETVPDESGKGDTVVAEGRGVRFALGELLSCPTCIATWTGAALYYGLRVVPRPTKAFLAVVSASGVAEIIHLVTEALSWSAEASRRKAAK